MSCETSFLFCFTFCTSFFFAAFLQSFSHFFSSVFCCNFYSSCVWDFFVNIIRSSSSHLSKSKSKFFLTYNLTQGIYSCCLILTDFFSNRKIIKVGKIRPNWALKRKQRTSSVGLEGSHEKVIFLSIFWVFHCCTQIFYFVFMITNIDSLLPI